MHVVVIGAGVIGVTSAWYLARSGCRVTLLDRNPAAGLGTSYANVGQISPALSAPWSSPGMLAKAITGMFAPFSPFVISRLPDREMAKWLWPFLANCNNRSYSQNKQKMVRLAEYSRDCLRTLRDELPIEYAAQERGTLVFFRDLGQLARYEEDLAVLDGLNVPFERIGRDRLTDLEPNLDVAGNNSPGGVLLPGDETGDCRRFTQALAARAVASGVDVRYGTTVLELVARDGRIRAVRVEGDLIEADAVVLAAGVDSLALLRPLRAAVPVYPVKGYSLTIMAESEKYGPRSTVSDETYKVGVTNLGDRIRVGGTAELAGYDLSRPDKRYKGLRHVARKLFPAIPEAEIDKAERWSGLRPMTPDGIPRIEQIGARNLYVNVGHGTLGWTMACGSARLLADVVTGEKPALELI
ncbi:MAG: D-amino acid dehydrogenase [Shinella sp.]|uniref:D-amino acid dehydrogenase n=1 Tax=Shinella sp. TaxID=1870904 RepID=UPI00403558B8